MISDKIPGILELPPEQRYLLAAELWGSVAYAQSDIPVTTEVKELLDERYAEMEKNPEDVISWEEIRNRMENRD